VTATAMLQRVHEDGGSILVHLDGAAFPARWSVASIRDGLVSFERINRRGVREVQTLRLELARIGP